MKSLFFYLLQVIVVSGILYAYYHLALRNKKFHQYNRFYILAATAASILIPFLNIPVYFTNDDGQWMHALLNLSGQPVVISFDQMPAEIEKPFNWNIVWYSLYAVIGMLGLARIVFSIKKLKKIMQEHPAEHLNGIRFINTAEPGTPFSFFRWLFWNNAIELDSEKGEQIFRHEVFHIQQKHSLDSIFMEIVTIIFWINPFFHLMKKELKAIHEFLADQFASNETQKWEYAEMLLMQALNTQHQLVHPFFHNQIKRRIAMITNPHKTSHQYLRKMLVLPLAALLVTLFAFSYKKKQSEELLKIEEVALSQPVTYSDTTPAGKQLVEEIRADVVAINGNGFTKQNQNIPPSLIIFNGKEYTQDEFSALTGDKSQEVVIESKYLITTPANDAQAIAKYGEKARNGVLEFKGASIDTIPPKKKAVEFSITESAPGKEPLVVLDGVQQERKPLQSVLLKINPNQIRAISILKDSSAIRKYGEKGEHGVLEITMKDNNTIQSEVKEVVIEGYETKKTNKVVAGKQLNPGLEEVTVVGYGTKKAGKQVEEITVVGHKRSSDSSRTLKLSGKKIPGQSVSILSKVDIDAAFPGGASAWYAFLSKNLDAAAPIKNNAPAGQYTVFIRMSVSAEGRIGDFKPLTNHGFGMEEAAIDALEKSPYWNAAYLDGKTVASYKNQPFTFVVKSDASPKLEEVTITSLAPPALIYPNPSANSASVKLHAAEAGDAIIRILDMEGKEKFRNKVGLIKGSNTFTVSIAGLAPGTYVVKVDGVKDQHLRASLKLVKE